MKTLLLLYLVPVALLAQDVGKEGVEGPASVKIISIWQMLIPIAVPLIIAFLKSLIPKLPSRLIPILAPIIGAAIDVILNLSGLGEGIGAVGAVMGAAGVGAREIYDQNMPEEKKKK